MSAPIHVYPQIVYDAINAIRAGSTGGGTTHVRADGVVYAVVVPIDGMAVIQPCDPEYIRGLRAFLEDESLDRIPRLPRSA